MHYPYKPGPWVVWRLDNAIHWIKVCPMDNAICFTLHITGPRSNLYTKVIGPGRLTLLLGLKIPWTCHCMNVWLDFTSLTLNWINRNLKFICYPFEVCIKISKSLQAWTTGLQEICMCVCFQHIKPGLCCTGTGRCSKKVCFAFSLVHISFSNNYDYSVYADF